MRRATTAPDVLSNLRYIYNKNDLWRKMRAEGKPKPQAAAVWEERFLPLLEEGAGTPACMEVAIKHGMAALMAADLTMACWLTLTVAL